MNESQNPELDFWKDNNGLVYFKDMKPYVLQACLIKAQERQLDAFSTLELNSKIEFAILKAAKERKIKLDSLENSNIPIIVTRVMKWNRLKDVITRVKRVIKLNLNKNGKAETETVL